MSIVTLELAVTVPVAALLVITVSFCISLSRNNRFPKIFARPILTIRTTLLALSACPPALRLLLTDHGLHLFNLHLNVTRTQLVLRNRAPLHPKGHRVHTPMRWVVPQPKMNTPNIINIQ